MIASMWFSPVCIIICFVISEFCQKSFHYYYIDMVSPMCILICITRITLHAKIFSQWVHEYGLTRVYLHISKMNLHISKMTYVYKIHLTMAALIWFLPCMYFDMLITITAFMLFLSCLYLHMFCKLTLHYKSTFTCKNLLTVSAWIWSHPVCIFIW